MPPAAADTTPAAHAAQIGALRRMTPERRFALAAGLSEDLRRVALAGILQRHPGYSEAEARRALVVLLYGEQIARALWPCEPLVLP
jgi:hypothetical protein